MTWVLLAFALMSAGFVQGLTGFGFGLVSMSLMPLAVSVKQAAAISTVFSLLATITTFFRHRHEYNWRLGLGFLLSACLGVPVGVYFLDRAGEGLLLRILGAIMVAFALWEFFFSKSPRELPRGLAIPLGLFSGGLSGAFNLGGIPTAAYAYAHPWTRGQVMAFLQVMITLSCALRIVLYQRFGYFKPVHFEQACLLLLPLYASIWAGHLALQHVPMAQMRRAVFLFIGLAGLYYVLGRPHIL